ncbi:MAG: hypothetical protein JKY04_07325 [Sneathiella sp.]|nr:hypothetical protein [Sneathiella sp.]
MKQEYKNRCFLRKVSGSKARYEHKPDYCDERHRVREFGSEMPIRGKLRKKGMTHLDTSPVKRWLITQVGLDFDMVFSNFIQRIQPKYRAEYSECVYQYVVKKTDVVIKEDGTIREAGRFGNIDHMIHTHYRPFYVNPSNNVLCRVNS